VADGAYSVKRYWDIPFCPDEEKLDWPEERIRDTIFELLLDATRIRLRADVPVGTYLSGGLDSSGITALVSKNFNNSVKTFGIRFEEQAFDEGAEQNEMVRYLNADHHELMALNRSIYKTFPDVVWFSEKPLLRTAPVPLYLLSALVRQSGRKVVLTGEGADEVFGGYNIYRENKVRRFWARRPDSSFRHLLVGHLYPYIFKDKRLAGMMKSFFSQGLTNTGDPLYSHLIRWGNTGRIKHLFSDDLRSSLGTYNCIEELRSTLPRDMDRMDAFTKAQYLEMSIFMSNYLLSSQGDRVAMGHSLEIRVPYLDHRLIEFMAKVPSKWKIRGMNEKYILKQVYRGILPQSIASRPKHPYRAPIREGLLDGDYQGELSERRVMSDGLFNPSGITALINKMKNTTSPSETDGMALTGVLSSQILSRQYLSDFKIDKTVAVTPTVFVDRTADMPHAH
jgi:asparagine synthase (glutamine-hydrolysing)